MISFNHSRFFAVIFLQVCISTFCLDAHRVKVTLAICVLNYNMNIQLFFSFVASIYSILVFTSWIRICAYYIFFWLISTAVLAFVTNSTTFQVYQSRPNILVLFYLFDGFSKLETPNNKLFGLDLITDSNNNC